MIVRPRRRATGVALAALALWLLVLQAASSTQAPAGPAASAQAPVEFNRDIRPVLSDKCYTCHGPGTQLGGLRFDREEAAKQALRTGHTAIVPGDAGASELLRRVTSTDPKVRMPQRGEPLDDHRWRCCAGGSNRARSGSPTGPSSRRRRRRFRR